MPQNPKALRSCTGFTLMEITFAILILAGSLVVLLGLQSSIVDRMIRDNQRQQAMMIARNVLAVLEANETQPVVQDVSGTLQEILESEGATDTEDQDLYQDLQSYVVRLAVSEWSPAVEGLALALDTSKFMLRVQVDVSWGDLPQEKIEVVYFVPAETE